MTTGRNSYELLVGTHLSTAILATFPVRLRPTAVPRQAVHRLRVGADRDLTEIVRRLTERQVQLLEIRLRPAGPPLPAPAERAPRPDAEAGGAVLRAVDGQGTWRRCRAADAGSCAGDDAAGSRRPHPAPGAISRSGDTSPGPEAAPPAHRRDEKGF